MAIDVSKKFLEESLAEQFTTKAVFEILQIAILTGTPEQRNEGNCKQKAFETFENYYVKNTFAIHDTFLYGINP